MNWEALGQWFVLSVFLLALYWLAASLLLVYFKYKGNEFLWLTKNRLVLAMIVFNAIDWLTTVIAVTRFHATELSPVLALFISDDGNIEWSFHISKLVLGSVAFISVSLIFDSTSAVFGYRVVKLRRSFFLGVVFLLLHLALYNVYNIIMVI